MVGLNRAYRRGRGWRRLRYQLSTTLLLAAVLPYLARYVTVSSPTLIANLTYTLVASIGAIIFGTWLYRSVSNYPGVEASIYIVPAFSISYALSLVILLFGRIEYNRLVLLAGFIISVVWSYYVYSKSQRRKLRFGSIPIGAVSAALELKSIDWVELKNPGENISDVDAIVVDLRTDLPDMWDRALADYALAGVPVYHCKHLIESLSGRVDLEHLSENNFGSLTPASAYMTMKHAIDWIMAFVALVLLAPALFLLMVAIRLDSAGSPIFRQIRIGYQGRPFTVYKFRTMTVAPAAVDDRAAAMTLAADQRVTRLGRFLRRSRIDELPQMMNILRGEMSWIGPRPEAEVLSRWYETEIAFYRYRHIVRPGLTGWAQVNQGHVADVSDVREKLQFDFFYIKNFSPWIDLLIVARTVGTVLTGFGAR